MRLNVWKILPPKFFLSTLQKKNSRKNRNFQCSINNSKKSKNFENLTFLSYNHIPKKNRFGRKLVLRKNSRFSVTFFLFFSIFLKNVGKFLLLTSIMHQGYSLCHRKPPPKFEIKALFRLVMLYTDTQKKPQIIVESIHSSLRSESKIYKWKSLCRIATIGIVIQQKIFVTYSNTNGVLCEFIFKIQNLNNGLRETYLEILCPSSYLWNYFLSNVNLEWDLTTQPYDIMDYGPSY
ncbi:hypothetical protein AGLY_012464 [Aphis glycines]|uniref:Uncharacterized protein n=1 Tax=Aphis glycines TaxID=307491 RepID=A0A6G0TAI4_APHGL|nr:hypothetical protein AGLY_012464 [Aphis glycines]